MKKILLPVLFCLLFSLDARTPQAKARRERINSLLTEVDYPCRFDNSKQKARIYIAKGKAPRPLLVALHTWGGNYKQSCVSYAAFCQKNNWNFIFPDFRGPNWRPSACGSEAVISDIADAVSYMKKESQVDNDRVYLIGGSGGGHASLLMAGRHPELWTAVSAWCPISDIAAWHDEDLKKGKYSYHKHIRRVCGGDPSKDPKAGAQAAKRSPVTCLSEKVSCIVDISTGIHDGHTGSVPVSHSFNAFNLLASPKDRIAAEDIAFVVKNRKIPAKFGKASADPSFGRRNAVLFRRQSGRARVTIFQGGHTILAHAGLEWLARQDRRKAPDWSVGKKAAGKASAIAK